MIDCIKVLPTADREYVQSLPTTLESDALNSITVFFTRRFPLYCRSGPPTNALLYAVFLLNQNISQLKYYLCLSRGDPRATLVNLHDILNVPSINVTSRTIEEPFQTIQTNISGSSSVELDVPDAFHQLTDLKESNSISR